MLGVVFSVDSSLVISSLVSICAATICRLDVRWKSFIWFRLKYSLTAFYLSNIYTTLIYTHTHTVVLLTISTNTYLSNTLSKNNRNIYDLFLWVLSFLFLHFPANQSNALQSESENKQMYIYINKFIYNPNHIRKSRINREAKDDMPINRKTDLNNVITRVTSIAFNCHCVCSLSRYIQRSILISVTESSGKAVPDLLRNTHRHTNTVTKNNVLVRRPAKNFFWLMTIFFFILFFPFCLYLSCRQRFFCVFVASNAELHCHG